MVILISAAAVLSWGCKKQPKCGCDGDALDTLRLMHVNISYDVDNKTARFSVLGDPYAVYYFCNPSEWMVFCRESALRKLITQTVTPALRLALFVHLNEV